MATRVNDDQARTISRGGVTTTIGLDPAGRRLTLTGSGDGGVVKNHYVDSSDNPGWSTSTVGGDTTLTRYESTIGGDLALTITDGVVSVALNSPSEHRGKHHRLCLPTRPHQPTRRERRGQSCTGYLSARKWPRGNR